MVTVSRPVVGLPPHVLEQSAVLDHVTHRMGDNPKLPAIRRLLENTTVQSRRAVLPLDEIVTYTGLGKRNRLYLEHAVAMATSTAFEALEAADCRAEDIDALVVASCTGHALPGIDAHLVNSLGLRPTVRRTPIAQMGCAGGAYALAQAARNIEAHPDVRHVLVVAVELPSLSYQANDVSISGLVSSALFGDACAAAVVSGDNRAGLRLGEVWEYLLPGSLDDMVYHVDEEGFHFDTLPSVTDCIARTVPHLGAWLQASSPDTDAWSPQFLVAHTGGPKIMDTLRDGLGCSEDLLRHSRASLRELGNTASVAVLDVLARTWQEATTCPEAPGLLVGFGPGVTTIAIRVTWAPGDPSGQQEASVEVMA
ncbi:type III polyketide synthase [Streptomyces zhihengii]|uniref:Type III polyketide synthase n=1 Tax=Streptomyces zhihengii TaxID=1818004 RepID=A0ABS2V3Y7_9ACTN|nr:type III polyketide synthase [Streptomyces zhihengii]MBM9624547.1 type III polyketide synthase [Streptomyces zhihengii]